MKVLVTGGAGYIGAHTCVKLLKRKHDVVIVDNLVNSKELAVERVREISGTNAIFYNIDVCNEAKLKEVFKAHQFDCVIHFAGLKAVGESVSIPLSYYDNNLNSTITLCKLMSEYNVKKIIFSSSATVYRADSQMPVSEEAELGCTNPYGWTKFMCEQILRDVFAADKNWSVALLRYFNPIGAHESGKIGEDPAGIPNNLVPYITKTALGKLEKLHIFGNDYPTKDGTGIRDYIHVEDLAEGHIAAMDYVMSHTGCEAFNLGTGKGYSVLDIVNTFEKINNIKVPYVIDGRRPGDIATVYSNPQKAKKLLQWEASHDLEDMCRDSWRWQKNNPDGYK